MMIKNLVILFVLSLISESGFSQLTSDGFPTLGLSYSYLNIVTDVSNIGDVTIASSGNMDWNFSGFIPEAESTFSAELVDAASAPNFDQFQESNYCLLEHFASGDRYCFYNLQSDSMSRVGTYRVNSNELEIYTNNQVELAFPFDTGDSYADQVESNLNSHLFNNACIARGSLLLPNNVFYSDVYLTEVFLNESFFILHAYFWFNSLGIPIAAYFAPSLFFPESFKYVNNIVSAAPAITVETTIDSDCNTGLTSVCYTASGGITPYGAICTDQNGTSFSAIGNCFNNLPPGTYSIVVADSGGDSEVFEIEVEQPLSVLVNLTTPVTCFSDCNGTAEFSVSGGQGEVTYLIGGIIYSYPEDFQNLCAGNYSVVALDDSGCQFEFSFQVIGPTEISASISIFNLVTCTGMNDGQITMATSGGIPPLITEFEMSNIDFDVLEIGDYPFTVTDSQGCVLNDTLHMTAVTESDFMVDISSTPVSCWNAQDGTATALVTGGVEPISILWNDDLEQETEIAIGLTNKQYTVVVEDAAGCFYIKKVTVDLEVGCLFIADALSPNNDGLNDIWNIGGLEFFPNSTVQVFNRWGQLLYENTSSYNVPWDGKVLGEPLPIADYYYIITNGGTDQPILGTVTIKY